MYRIAYKSRTGISLTSLAPSASEMLEKIKIYRAVGVIEFYVTDPNGKALSVFELEQLAGIKRSPAGPESRGSRLAPAAGERLHSATRTALGTEPAQRPSALRRSDERA